VPVREYQQTERYYYLSGCRLGRGRRADDHGRRTVSLRGNTLGMKRRNIKPAVVLKGFSIKIGK